MESWKGATFRWVCICINYWLPKVGVSRELKSIEGSWIAAAQSFENFFPLELAIKVRLEKSHYEALGIGDVTSQLWRHVNFSKQTSQRRLLCQDTETCVDKVFVKGELGV